MARGDIKFRKVRASGDLLQTFSSEDGRHFRGIHQNLDGAIDRVKHVRDMHDYATKATNPNGWKHLGSIPQAVLIDWLQKHNYTHNDWATNQGGTRCPAGNDPVAHATLDGGVRSQFLRYFLSRDFSKLHNHQVTTKRSINQFVVPKQKSKAVGQANGQFRRTKDRDSQLA
jgi:hypothetical protein